MRGLSKLQRVGETMLVNPTSKGAGSRGDYNNIGNDLGGGVCRASSAHNFSSAFEDRGIMRVRGIWMYKASRAK